MATPFGLTPWVEEENPVVAAQAAREAASRNVRRSVTQRHDGDGLVELLRKYVMPGSPAFGSMAPQDKP